jgi:hypothetical protein
MLLEAFGSFWYCCGAVVAVLVATCCPIVVLHVAPCDTLWCLVDLALSCASLAALLVVPCGLVGSFLWYLVANCGTVLAIVALLVVPSDTVEAVHVVPCGALLCRSCGVSWHRLLVVPCGAVVAVPCGTATAALVHLWWFRPGTLVVSE